MAPNMKEQPVATESTNLSQENDGIQGKPEFKRQIVWTNVIICTFLHICAVYGLKLFFFDVQWKTVAWTYFLYVAGGTGITAGAHRLWSHRAYKATLPLRIYLSIANASALGNDIYEWCRDHRLHHKYSETDADPYSATRGFFFCHIGWVLSKKHPDVMEKGKGIDLSDLVDDPVVMFQKKHYVLLAVIFCYLVPIAVPSYFWGESLWNCLHVCIFFRHVAIAHSTFFVNSAAHLWGDRPYDKSISPRESMIAIIASSGEGFHNYHHTFPWDYRASEWGWQMNGSTMLIDLWHWMGLAYDLKTVPQDVIQRRRQTKGDGSKIWYPEELTERKQN